MAKILCFGDSITYGAWDSQGGWVARLRQKVDRICIESDLEKFYLTFNLGVSSDTSERILDRFDGEVSSRMLEEGDPYYIFSMGTNDSIWLNKENKHWVELDEFEGNVHSLIEKAKKYHTKIVFLGNLPVDEDRTHPYRDDDDIESSNKDIREYEITTQNICEEEQVDFIPIFDEALKGEYKKLLFNDGVHPNDLGHAYLAEKIWNHIDQNDWIT